MGLLDFFTSQDPAQRQGLLSATAALLQAGGPSRVPISTGQGLASALQAFQQGKQGYEDRQQQHELYGLKLADAQSDLANQELLRARQKRIAERLSGASGAPTQGDQQAPMASALPGGAMSPKIGGPDWLQAFQQQNGLQLPTSTQPGAAPRGNQTDAYVQRMMTIAQAHADEGDIDGATKIYEQVQKLRPKFSNDVTWVNGSNGKQVGLRFADDGTQREVEGYAQQQDPNKPFSIGADGKPVANSAYQTFELSKARAGASNVSVNTATKPFLSEIGKGAGEAVNAAYQGALAATRTLQNVDQIRQGLGNAIMGPGANARVTLAQLGQTLGVTGKNTAEQLANTRMVVQGLARQELSAAEQMKGQGQITESERGILRRAESGMIGDFTAPEINTLLTALEKTARYRVGQHQANMQRLEKDPNARGIVDYMRVDIPTASAPQPTPTSNVRRYNPATGRIE
jgi:hypothetical protein